MLALLAFVWLAVEGRNLPVLAAVIALTNFTDGLGTVIFVAYLSALCENRQYTATQYALLSALAAIGRTVFSAATGWLAATTGWSHFFLLSMLAGVPGLLLLWRIGHTVRDSRAFDPSPGQA
jgi:PAT family beta-lactamase induction signal transducer AmpG